MGRTRRGVYTAYRVWLMHTVCHTPRGMYAVGTPEVREGHPGGTLGAPWASGTHGAQEAGRRTPCVQYGGGGPGTYVSAQRATVLHPNPNPNPIPNPNPNPNPNVSA